MYTFYGNYYVYLCVYIVMSDYLYVYTAMCDYLCLFFNKMWLYIFTVYLKQAKRLIIICITIYPHNAIKI